MVNVYLSYLKENKHESRLYAYGTDKKVFKSFKSTRNRKMFKFKKEELTQAELKIFERKYGHLKLTLETRWAKSGMFDFAYTEVELSVVEDTAMFYSREEVFNRANFNPFLFNDEFMYVLDSLYYSDAYSFSRNGSPDILEDIDADYLGILFSIYGNLIGVD